MVDPSTTQMGRDRAPEWERIGEQVVCPLCGYDLRGLVEPRCPECGYGFTWGGLFEARRTVHPYLFEHHPERNGWAFLRTAVGGVRPGRFWGRLTAAHSIRMRRLVLYWVLACLPMGGVLGVCMGRAAWRFYDVNMGNVRAVIRAYNSVQAGTPDYAEFQEIIKTYGSVEAYARRRYYAPGLVDSVAAGFEEHRPLVVAYGLWAVWPWVMGGMLLVYRRSMRQAAIRSGHVARCVVYGGDGMWWVGAAALVAMAWVTGRAAWECYTMGLGMEWMEVWDRVPGWVVEKMPWVWHALMVLGVYRVGVAYRKYLRFDGKAWGAVGLAGVASLLVAWVLYLWLAGARGVVALWTLWG